MSEMVELIKLYNDYKEQELVAKKNKDLVGEQIVALVNNQKTEGSETKDFDNFKVTVTKGVSRKVNFDALKDLNEEMAKSDLAFIDYKPAINLKKLRLVEKVVGPETKKLLDSAITITPSKPSLKIKEVEGD